MITGRYRKWGRPPAKETTVKIRLKQSVFEMWRNKKQASGYGQRSHSIFAEYLLHCGHGNTIGISKRQRLDFGVNSPSKYSLISSVDFAISSLALCLSKALVGSLCAFSVSMLCCRQFLHCSYFVPREQFAPHFRPAFLQGHP